MKTKLYLLLTAVMLLLSANVFAQSGSTNPVKGDMNGDGTVDVADIAVVIRHAMSLQRGRACRICVYNLPSIAL